MNSEEYHCPKCGLEHRLLHGDTPETKVKCISCGHIFHIGDAKNYENLVYFLDI